jgi:hypothetical protein
LSSLGFHAGESKRAADRSGGGFTTEATEDRDLEERTASQRAALSYPRMRVLLLAATLLQFSDRARIISVSDPQIAPDGTQVAVVVSRPNVKENRNDTDIALVDVTSGATRRVTFERRGVAQPRWSLQRSVEWFKTHLR